MFTQTWRKYLPVILILLKRSVNGDQTLVMNHTDFERAAGGRKIKFSFSNLKLNNGKLDSTVKHSTLARDLATLLQEDDTTRRFILNKDLEFSLSGNFELYIRNSTVPAEEVIVDPTVENLADTGNSETAGEPNSASL